jgi:hypothetical protein
MRYLPKATRKHEPTIVVALNIPVVETHDLPSCSSCARNREMDGRLGSMDSYSSYHDCTSSPHNTSENPTAGRSGRFPSMIWM